MFDPRNPPLPRKQQDKIRWGNLPGSSALLALASAACQHSASSVVITQSMEQADRITRELKLFLRDEHKAPPVMQFGDWETLPYDSFSPHQDIISERLRCLYNLANDEHALVVVAAPTLMQRLPPRDYILGRSLVLKKGQQLQREHFATQLSQAGYNNVDTVYQHGEFALRGALIDVFPMGSSEAYRIELFDDEVDSLRAFDPDTQRTVEQVEGIELLPGRECPVDDDAIATFKENWYANFDVDAKSCPLFVDVCNGLSPAGIEYYLPLFFRETANFFDYIPDNSLLMVFDGFNETIEEKYREILKRFDDQSFDIERPLLKPALAFQQINELHAALNRFARITLQKQACEERAGNHNFSFQALPDLHIDSKAQQPLHRLETWLADTDKHILFCAETKGRKETLKEHLQKIGLVADEVANIAGFLNSKPRFAICVADIAKGFQYTIDASTGFAFVTENLLFGERVQQHRRRKKSSNIDHENIVRDLTELQIGAPVVHIDHGVGRYQGLQSLDHGGQKDEFLVLLYADDAKLYVPVANLHVISRYSGAEDSLVPLHRLGSEHWQRAKRKAAEQLRDVAAELLEIYAKRKAREGFAYRFPKDAYQIFTQSFPFEETPDQEAAIDAVRYDMLAPQPMDRLVCGDVGFGKTEVAMRAAFIAVQNNKQVAVLVPTTLLAQQHFDNFQDRFADWPVNIALVSRFKSKKEITEVQKKLEQGKIDIVIGTHKLIQGDLTYPNLGLVIIDEEHRFGVRQKDSLKALRAEVDVLAMTATPIPRTLNLSMSGIRDLSIIATPPAKRLSIKTFVRKHENALIREAISREINRGGQVYYLHNEVLTIERVARELSELVPEARIRIGHGQMRERELESVMSDFYHKRFNVLVCTTIIETGIDVPSANTIIINRADKFGLAQLHQLRGRVGRSHHQAYAYLLTPDKKAMTSDARKRLEAIVEAQDLGAGFTLASHDLEIRGAGELLGEEQSGQMQAIGFSLYMELLERAVKAIQEGKTFDIENTEESLVDINLRIPALIPEEYLPDVHIRLTLYKRISSVKDEEELEALQVEMIDRFGLLPDALKNLIRQTRLRFRAEHLGIIKVEANAEGGKIEFAAKTRVDPLTIVNLVQRQPQHYKLEGASKLRFNFDMEDSDARLTTVHNVLNNLAKAS